MHSQSQNRATHANIVNFKMPESPTYEVNSITRISRFSFTRLPLASNTKSKPNKQVSAIACALTFKKANNNNDQYIIIIIIIIIISHNNNSCNEEEDNNSKNK